MKNLRTMRIALLLAGMGAVSVSPLHAAAGTTVKHKKSSSAKPSNSTAPKNSSAARPPSKAGSSTAKSTKSSSGRSTKRTAGKRSTGRQRGQMAPTPERISEIQQALAKNGAFAGEPSGKWDDSTADAMRKFQAAHGLNPSGKLDALTLNQLGLGSSTAGVARPTPVVRTSSSALPADIQQ